MNLRLVQSIQMLIARWVTQVRVQAAGDLRRAEAAVELLGLTDVWLAERLVEAGMSDAPESRCARDIWEAVSVWPDAEPTWRSDSLGDARWQTGLS
jgi:hypothetical protein